MNYENIVDKYILLKKNKIKPTMQTSTIICYMDIIQLFKTRF